MSLAATIRKRVSDAFALDVSISVPAGVTILFGASGSGKSTVLRAVAGLLRPDAGSITVGSRVLFDRNGGIDVPARDRHVGYVFQHLALFPHLTVEENLMFGLQDQTQDARRRKVRAIAASFKIDHLLSRRPAQTSGGERQRTALARSLVTNPSALLLDEPLSALDHPTQSLIIDDLRRWNAEHQIPILYVTHSHREVFALGDRVVVLHNGSVAAAGTPHDVLEMPEQASLAQLAGFENVMEAAVLARKMDAGTMHCRLTGSQVELEVPLAHGSGLPLIQIAIRAGDILLATEPPRGLSARNILRGRLLSLTRDGAAMVAVVDCGTSFVVHLTPSAADGLGLAIGQDVWLVIKTYSCRVAA
ncbi:MAG TPA: molybdenum ABC transporter ATP-binding protein [Vicinamibacterales bacterium]|nr:molybdenum ABC transporter ATP-binding protein [Vicinamibacterales bacterium]